MTYSKENQPTKTASATSKKYSSSEMWELQSPGTHVSNHSWRKCLQTAEKQQNKVSRHQIKLQVNFLMNSNQMCRQIKAGEKFSDFNKNNKKSFLTSSELLNELTWDFPLVVLYLKRGKCWENEAESGDNNEQARYDGNNLKCTIICRYADEYRSIWVPTNA